MKAEQFSVSWTKCTSFSVSIPLHECSKWLPRLLSTKNLILSIRKKSAKLLKECHNVSWVRPPWKTTKLAAAKLPSAKKTKIIELNNGNLLIFFTGAIDLIRHLRGQNEALWQELHSHRLQRLRGRQTGPGRLSLRSLLWALPLDQPCYGSVPLRSISIF